MICIHNISSLPPDDTKAWSIPERADWRITSVKGVQGSSASCVRRVTVILEPEVSGDAKRVLYVEVECSRSY